MNARRDFQLHAEWLDESAALSFLRSPACGAEVVFHGVVRSPSRGQEIEFLEFEAYPDMVWRELNAIADELEARWPCSGIFLHHRTGRVFPGETAVIAAIASAHRKEAFEACEWLMDQLKSRVPIWKKECSAGGSAWVMPHP